MSSRNRLAGHAERSLAPAPLLLLATLVAGTPLGLPAQSETDRRPTAVPHGNVAPAGVAGSGTLALRLVARPVRWHPEAETGPALDVEAFGEEGRAPSIPGPLVRIRAGTRVESSIRNALPDTLLVFGLSGTDRDTVRIPPGGTGLTRFTARTPGTYAYGGATIVGDSVHLLGTGNQLLGALVVDAADPPPDRIFVLSIWPTVPGRFVMAINGRSWPHTERLAMDVGDSVHWRVVNGTRGRHPMHLHGFYFRVDARGSWSADTAAGSVHRTVVTESVPYRGTFAMTWTAERPGNWLFHCHDALHTSWRRRFNLSDERPPATLPVHDAAHHAEQDMSGLILGITVRDTGGSRPITALAPPARRVRVAAIEQPAVYGREPGFSYVTTVRDGAVPDRLEVPARPIVLTQGERAELTVVNRLSIPTAVHWHGIELESFYDGVAGWSGNGVTVAPLIAPGDSFLVRMTPPRAGTFIFHAHADDMRQMALGLYGPLIVLPPGQQWDPATDHLFVVSQLGRGQGALIGLNGGTARSVTALAAGVRHRLRFINISVAADARLTLARMGGDAGSDLRWRAVAKDGADVHRDHAVERPADLFITPGETYDFAVTLPAGDYRLRMQSSNDVDITLRVR